MTTHSTVHHFDQETNKENVRVCASALGGIERLIVMCGAKLFVAINGGIRFALPKSHGNKWNKVEIFINDKDEISVNFFNLDRDGKIVASAEHDGIPFENVMDLFERETGLFLTIGRRH